VLELAGDENVVVRTSDGRQFVLAEIDDFTDEVARTSQNVDLMRLLDKRSKETECIPLAQVREQLKAGKRSRSTTKSAKNMRHRPKSVRRR
jgi:hypothetical protein